MIAKPVQLVIGLLLAAAPIGAMAQDAPDLAAVAHLRRLVFAITSETVSGA